MEKRDFNSGDKKGVQSVETPKDRNIYVVKCPKTQQHFVIEEALGQQGGVINFCDIEDSVAEKILFKKYERGMTVSPALRACRWCGTRRVGGCSCRENRGQCPPKGVYNYQCLFCGKLEGVRFGGDVRDLRLAVTASGFDDIGALLDNMGFKTRSFSSTGFDCDVLFVNCGTKDVVDPAGLREFVSNGGCAYISDLAISYLNSAFPNAVTTINNGVKGKYPARIEDPELKSIIGGSISVFYDMDVWAVIQHHRGECLIRGARVDMTKPMMVSFTEGKGKVFYTSFHNHAQASKEEQALLKLMLLRQIGEVCHQSIREVGEVLGLNISSLGASAQKR